MKNLKLVDVVDCSHDLCDDIQHLIFFVVWILTRVLLQNLPANFNVLLEVPILS